VDRSSAQGAERGGVRVGVFPSPPGEGPGEGVDPFLRSILVLYLLAGFKMANIETYGGDMSFSRFWLWAVGAAVAREFDVILGLGFETAACCFVLYAVSILS